MVDGCIVFVAIPAMQNMLKNKDRVSKFAGELHLSLTSESESTEARKPEGHLIAATKELFEKRGCTWQPTFSC